MPRLTVAILAYNRPEFLGEAIQSVLNQTYTDFKLIVYDNCSEKDIKSVVDSFDDSRVSYHRNSENLGLYGNAEKAIALCDTELLDIFHDDDRMFPWALEWLVEAMDRYPSIGLASSLWIHAMGSGDFAHFVNDKSGELFKQKEAFDTIVKDLTIFRMPGVMLRVSVLQEKGCVFRQDKYPTADLWLYFLMESNCLGVEFYAYNSPLIEYRLHGGRLTKSMGFKRWNESLKCTAAYAVSQGVSPQWLDWIKPKHVIDIIRSEVINAIEDDSLNHECLTELRERFETDMEYKLTDYQFADAVAVGALLPVITAVGRCEKPISDYIRNVKELAKAGIKVPFMRNLKWFIKYIILKRWLGRP